MIPICLGCGEKVPPNPLNWCKCEDLHGEQREWEIAWRSNGTGEKYWSSRDGRKLKDGEKCETCGREAPPLPDYCLCEMDGSVLEGEDGELAICCEPEPYLVEQYDPPLCPFCNRDISDVPKEPC